jgi:hypothetical protein
METRDILREQCYINHSKYFAYLLRTGQYSAEEIIKGG